MSKREPSTDIPRRIYRSTVERIAKHLADKPNKRRVSRKEKAIRTTFNDFLIELLNVYEELKVAPVYYVNKYYEDPSEARGEAISEAVKSKKPVKFPVMMISVGEDDIND